MQNAPATARPIVIDEIAHMSMLSETFRTEVTRVFESGIPIIATIHIRPDPFTDALKARQDVRLLTLNDENRMQVQTELIAAIDRMLA
jgi:nucleoside-triphosphatase THEP1